MYKALVLPWEYSNEENPVPTFNGTGVQIGWRKGQEANKPRKYIYGPEDAGKKYGRSEGKSYGEKAG